MSFAGSKIFDKNLRTLADSEAYKNADDVERLRLCGKLLRSKYGLGSRAGFGPVHELKLPPSPEARELNPCPMCGDVEG